MSLIILVLPIAVMFLLFRSQKKRQQQSQHMQSSMEPGAAVRTIGGMYATVKSIGDSTVELEIAPGVFTHFAKSAVAAVIDAQEYDEIINGRPAEDEAAAADEADDTEAVADAVVTDEAAEEAAEESVSLEKAGDQAAAK
ncbi:preprotein translocase subunit YajC [Kitasatospora sp. GP30]|uniref:preprotein translocase subunit YajC n=1 Tax=Kitasatospora sp. GP30 TaxID=3035084 RepID=UPI000C701D91|nr:preprotein translocase subunit YajC [Kitasatospora sp. GP30]MDH6139785.1 preprotein translocase subunit YajC [Kitasatospora sp. GP30]